MIVDRDPRKRRVRLALRPRRQAQHVLCRKVRDVAVLDHHARGDVQVAEPLGDLRICDHAAADERHLAVELRGQVDEDLHSVQARRERAHDQLALGAGEELLEGVDDLALGTGEPAPIDVRAVAEQRQHALGSQLREAGQVEGFAVERRLIDLEVAGMDDDALRRVDGHRHAIGHAVRHADELDPERADGHDVARLDRHQARSMRHPVLVELGLDERQRQRRAVERAVDEGQHVGDRADVVFVAMRQYESLDLAASRRQIGEVRDDQVDAGQFGVGEHRTGVDDDGGVSTRDRHHVEAELAEAAKRHHIDRQCTRGAVRRSQTVHEQNPSQRGTLGGHHTTADFRRWEA